jgi:hypothetical protein
VSTWKSKTGASRHEIVKERREIVAKKKIIRSMPDGKVPVVKT